MKKDVITNTVKDAFTTHLSGIFLKFMCGELGVSPGVTPLYPTHLLVHETDHFYCYELVGLSKKFIGLTEKTTKKNHDKSDNKPDGK